MRDQYLATVRSAHFPNFTRERERSARMARRGPDWLAERLDLCDREANEKRQAIASMRERLPARPRITRPRDRRPL